MNKEKYINFEQIIPVKDIEDYMISMADKSQSDISIQEEGKSRHKIRYDFWNNYLSRCNEIFDLYKNVSPSKDNWISGATGITGVGFNSVISKKYARAELYISRSKKEDNKFIFDELFKIKSKLESLIGQELIWERLDNKKASRIKCELSDVNYFNKDDWQQMIEFMSKSMKKMVTTFKDPLIQVKILL